MFQPVQWVTAWEMTQIPVPLHQATGTPGTESVIELKKEKIRPLRQGAKLSGWAGPTPTKTKKQLETLRVESFTASTAETRIVQLSGEGVSAVTEALDPYGGTLPLLMQPAVAEATHHNRESPPLQRQATITTAVLTTPI